MPLFNKVLIIGLGLIGGSIALAIKKHNLAGEITGIDMRTENIKGALNQGAIDRACELPAGVAGAELIILATPVGVTVEILDQVIPAISPGTIVTDVASVKKHIVEQVTRVLPANIYFVGGHPMAGSEKSGFTNATAGLLKDAYYFITPTKDIPSAAVQKVVSLVKGLQAIPLELSPHEHDRVMAVISHLPHLAAVALVNTLQAFPGFPGIVPYAAGGFRDTTRIASGVPEMWKEILMDNRNNLIPVLDNFISILEKYKCILESESGQPLLEQLESACQVRKSLTEKRMNQINEYTGNYTR